MSQKEKLIRRLKSKPKDFTFNEISVLLGYFSYKCFNKGKTSSSRIIFVSKEHPSITLHKTHSRKELLTYQIKQIIEMLEQEGLI